jgi:hypothetical protein
MKQIVRCSEYAPTQPEAIFHGFPSSCEEFFYLRFEVESSKLLTKAFFHYSEHSEMIVIMRLRDKGMPGIHAGRAPRKILRHRNANVHSKARIVFSLGARQRIFHGISIIILELD